MDKTRNDVVAANRELVKDFSPAKAFAFFADISGVPRPSGDTGGMTDFLVRFAEDRGLSYQRDELGNVIIAKPARGGGPTVILQAHVDMVRARTADSTHDFAADPIRFVRDGEWLKADRTTLGADNGMGVALILALLDDDTLPHPPLEGLFTVEEETTMAGMNAIRADQLRGDILINLDSEELGFALVSSAAVASHELRLPLDRDPAGKAKSRALLAVGGLRGGHSGVQINEGRANAFSLLARVLSDLAEKGFAYGLERFGNGAVAGAANGIPAHAEAVLSLADDAALAALRDAAAEWEAVFKHEYRASDPGVFVSVAEPASAPLAPMTADSRARLLRTVRLMPLGVARFVQDDRRMAKPLAELLVETSNNMGVVETTADEACLTLAARGSVESTLADLGGRFADLAALAGGKLVAKGHNPGWEMADPPSRVQKMFQDEGLTLLGIHAGLECGTLAATLKAAGRTLDAVSIGPDIVNPHSPAEALRIDTVLPLWTQLTHILAKLASALPESPPSR